MRDRFDPALIERLTYDLGIGSLIGYILLLALGTVLFVPGRIFGVARGAWFGPQWGIIPNLIGATLGATAAFLIARIPSRKIGGGARLGRLIAG
jgi:uncharacterized membrane protein YdjX (TVP38/TMEM64 family)